jgi:probable rRNA maturation factor
MRTLFETLSFSISTTIGKDTPKIKGVFFHDIKEKVLGKEYELSLVFVGTDRMRALNKQHRGKDYATDILSFDLDGCDCEHDHGEKSRAELKYGSGEIFINPDKARIKAKEFGRSFENYVKFLFVHGLMHLKGHDHEDDEGAERMEKAEKRVRAIFNI